MRLVARTILTDIRRRLLRIWAGDTPSMSDPNESTPGRQRLRRWLAGMAALLTIIASGVPALGAPGSATMTLPVTAAVGESRAEPAPAGQPVTAGPWTLTIAEMLTGEDAAGAVANASGFNPAPASGMQYIAVHLTATNNDDKAHTIAGEDFAVTGDSLLVHRFADATPPDPALSGVVESGASLDGWIVLPAVADEGNLLLIYDSVTLTGSWADVVVALSEGAAIAGPGERAAEPNDAGKQIDGPAALGDAVATDDWSITVSQVIEGQDVYNLFPVEDYRTTALGDTDQAGLPYWIGLEVTVTNNQTGDAPAFLPATALLPIDTQGNVIGDALLLTPPEPDLIGGYYPGGSRTGWVLIAMPVGTALELVRFQPYATDQDPRFITLHGVAGAPDRGEVTFAPGDIVAVTDDRVNLREEPTTESDVVTELDAGTRLEITGEAIEAGGYTWYPVRNPETDDEGFIVVDYIEPVD